MSTIQDDDGKNENNENDNDIVLKTNKCFKVFFFQMTILSSYLSR